MYKRKIKGGDARKRLYNSQIRVTISLQGKGAESKRHLITK
ncbi:hypothetical protein Kirov_175 [Bacillus phage Kirov]|uniref:Uncharacterized protein n=1 Tax=Bacillus phage Kirov TaxID=2783539 RepID=A0A7U3RZ23_9CAUD|nr:hypothetical protein PQE67_gp129 [Bacillus phage Kirov]QOV08374.1 hypothetical protein Kirov_175 [Bacillus phage Kirov]